ncbi:MAG: NAD-binding protein [Armatimonadetes bacterium]|nr:NAD-binding protein [Armatimonadota bacterium]
MAHVIVCGLGQVGYRVVDLLLRLGEDVTVVTQDTRQEFLVLTEAAGAKVVHGDARADKFLKEAGIDSAVALITCVDDDVTNIEIALDAKRLNPAIRVVARLFDQTLARRLESSVGISKVLGMSVLAAPAFAGAAFGEAVYGTFTYQGQGFVATKLPGPDGAGNLVPIGEYVENSIAPESRRERSLKGFIIGTWRGIGQFWHLTPVVLRAVALAIIVLSVLSVFVFQIGMHLHPVDAIYFVVTTLTTTGYGDINLREEPMWLKVYGCLLMLLGSASVATLYSLITNFIVSARFDEMLGRKTVRMSGHVVLVGLGNVGFRTAENLTEMGADVAVIELNPEATYRQFLADEVAFIAGDGRDTETLERAGMRQASALIVATQNDAVNLSVALAAHTMNANARVVVRLFDADFARKVQEVMVVSAALSASRIAAPGFVGAALYGNALLCYVHDDRFCSVVPDAEGRLTIDERTLRGPVP